MTTHPAVSEVQAPLQQEQPPTFLAQVFKLNPAALNWPRAVMLIDVLLVALVVLLSIGKEQYLWTAILGVVYTAAADPGGPYGSRALRIAGFGIIGAAVTALGFAISTGGWGWLVLAAFVVTVVAGLTVKFGLHRFAAFNFLNTWFFIALALGSNDDNIHVTSHTWAQAVTWLGATALWIAFTFVVWLIRGRKDQPPPAPELPGDISRRKLTAPLIVFAVLRALGMAAAVAITYGLNLSHADWLPVAAIIAMKPSLDQSTVVAVQRLAGALIGACAAALLMLIPLSVNSTNLAATRHALEVVAIFLLMHGAAIIFWNYAVYTATIATAVLVSLDLPHPSSYSANGQRVVYTLIGVAIAVLVMFVGSLLGKLAARHASGQPPES
jgi:uncharacterized membrane protein YccC